MLFCFNQILFLYINRFYPHHYAPYISDVKDFSNMQINFELAKPFLPFQQLMAVLPAASKELLPAPYQVNRGWTNVEFCKLNTVKWNGVMMFHITVKILFFCVY